MTLIAYTCECHCIHFRYILHAYHIYTHMICANHIYTCRIGTSMLSYMCSCICMMLAGGSHYLVCHMFGIIITHSRSHVPLKYMAQNTGHKKDVEQICQPCIYKP